MSSGVDVVLVAAGSSARFEGGDKLFANLCGKPVLAHSLQIFERVAEVTQIAVVVRATSLAQVERMVGNCRISKPYVVVAGGARRRDSVWHGLQALDKRGASGLTLVHDGARPLTSPELVRRIVRKTRMHGAAVPVVPIHNAIKKVTAQKILGDGLSRSGLVAAQTPQGFKTQTLVRAHREADASIDADDDAELLQNIVVPVHIVDGDPSNLKLTSSADLELARRLNGRGAPTWRWGSGYDCHALSSGDGFKLGGVQIDCELAVEAHSDGDVLLHAVSDALLGVAGAGDLGAHFPSSDQRWRDADSTLFVNTALELVNQAGLKLDYLDATVIAERPKLAKYSARIAASIASLLGLDNSQVNIKVTGTDGVQSGSGLCAQVTVTTRKSDDPKRRDSS